VLLAHASAGIAVRVRLGMEGWATGFIRGAFTGRLRRLIHILSHLQYTYWSPFSGHVHRFPWTSPYVRGFLFSSARYMSD
jgi:hypothetical protein